MENENKVLKILQGLGFDIIRGEKNREYLDKIGVYRLTPDFIQRDFIGGGSPLDFFIDLNEPDISYFRKKTALGQKIYNALSEKKRINFTNNDIDRKEIEKVLKSYNDKIEKYSKSRDGSPLFGWVTYFNSTKHNSALDLYIQFFYMTLIDRAMGTALYKRKIILDRKWMQKVNKNLRRYIIDPKAKIIIESVLHDKCVFL